MALQPGTRIGAYEITGTLGAGGMGEVYRATDTNLKRAVAIKVLPDSVAADRERLARFQREAELLASLNHPNIAQIHGLEKSGGTTALVMELVEGPTLADRIAKGPIPIDEALPIAKQIAEALGAAHEQGIIHRDLKPANIKLRPDGTVKVLDFGLAKALEPVSGAGLDVTASPTITSPAMMTGVGVLLGTAAYMAPEQARGKTVDKRADIWAFGCVLYEMLTGRRAFDGDDMVDVLGAVARLDPIWAALPPDVPPLIRTLLQSCLAKDRRRRVADISTALFVLDKAASLPVASVTTRPAKRRWLSYVAAIAATVVVVASPFALMRREALPPAAIRRFSLDLAGNTAFSGTGRHVVAVSPDGSMVAFVARNRIYLRAMDNLQAKPVEGTELGGSSGYGRNPFFSPDGQWIGFAQAGELKKVSAAGGAIVTIARNVDIPFGATWLDDDTILFGAGASGIWRVVASGGSPKQIVTVKEGQFAHGPQLLPDHDHVLFTLASGSDWNEAQIVAQSLSTGARTVLVPQGTDGRYVEGGYLLYGLRGTVFAAPVDIANLTLRGAAVPVLENVSQAPFQTGSVQFSASRDGTLAYAAEANLVPNRRLTWIDRSGRSTTLPSAPAPFVAWRLSPDGKTVVVERRDDGGDSGSIWTVDAVRGTESRLTQAGIDRRHPVWSEDGRFVLYGSQRERRVFRQAADGTGRREEIAVLDQGQSGLRPLRLDVANGSVLVQSVGGSIGGINRVSLRDGHDTVVVPGADGFANAELSPDGRWIAYESSESGRSQVYVRRFPNVDDGRWQISTGGGTRPVWGKGGRELFYVEPAPGDDGGQRMAAVPILVAPRFSAGAPTVLFETKIGDESMIYDVTPDGERFLMGSVVRGASDAAARIVIVENWFEELKRRVPTN